MNIVPDLPTGNFTILCLAGLVCLLFSIFCYLAYASDERQIATVSAVTYFQEKIPPADPVYIVTLRIEACYVYSGSADLIFRLRGSKKDSPLILFRDYDGSYLAEGKVLNVGFSLPFDLGSILEIDVACDNDDTKEGEGILVFSDLFIRRLPRKANALTNSKTMMMLEKNESPFEALSKNVQTWASVETFKTGKGVGVLGVSVPEIGRTKTVRARDVALTLTLQEETPTLKRTARIGFRPLHYVWSQSSHWHEAWSDFSEMDHVMVMFLDLILLLVLVSTCYAFALEKFIGFHYISPLLEPIAKQAGKPVVKVEEFDLLTFFLNIQQYLVVLAHIAWVSLMASFVVIPLSVIWCRLFRLIGGKGFEKALENAQPPLPQDVGKSRHSRFPLDGAPHASAGDGGNYDHYDDFPTGPGPTLMIRTLECKSTHTASCVTSSRRLRMEPLLANCPADHITARSVAYIRTKMARLRDEDIPSGISGLKHPEVLHESHTQSTDAPQMPPPSSAPDGTGDIVRISRYCERLVQQAAKHIRDNSVIAECFEFATDAPDHLQIKKPGDGKFVKKCCPKKCCGKDGPPDESISNLTFFTEEDAISLQEMVDHLPSETQLNTKHESPHPHARAKSEAGDAGKWDNEDYEEAVATPKPSAKPSDSSLSKIRNMFESAVKSSLKIKSARGQQRSTRSPGLQVLRPSQTDLIADSNKRLKKMKGVRFELEKNESNYNTRFKKGDHHKNQRKGKPKPKSSPRGKSTASFPHPSAGPRSNPTPIYDPVAPYHDYDWTSAKSHFSTSEAGRPDDLLPQSTPFKGKLVKISIFLFLSLLQLGEIYFVTAFEMKENKFFALAPGGRGGAGAGRMHAALVSSGLCLIWYFLFTIHLVALVSYLIDYIYLQMTSKDEDDFDDDASYVSRHSINVLP